MREGKRGYSTCKKGYTNPVIAQELNITINTVKKHLQNI
ncbi:helix-turn-helix transcriptional regulator [Ureibacillus sp. MALMAid1270]